MGIAAFDNAQQQVGPASGLGPAGMAQHELEQVEILSANELFDDGKGSWISRPGFLGKHIFDEAPDRPVMGAAVLKNAGQ